MENTGIINYNEEVIKAQKNILNVVREIISRCPERPLRQVLIRSQYGIVKPHTIVYEFLNPLIYLRLECSKESIFNIHYGYEQTERFTKYYPITSAFIRSIYRFTTKENTEINIEDCVHTDWVITNCAELFEYIGDRNKYHKVSTIEFMHANIKEETLLPADLQ